MASPTQPSTATKKLGSSTLMTPEQGEPDPALLKRRFQDACEVDRGRLYYVSLPEGCTPTDDEERVYCATDVYVYQHFFADFGPLHLGHVYAFCKTLGTLLERQQQRFVGSESTTRRKPVYVYSSDHLHRRSNAIVLVLAYAVLCLGKTAEEAYTPFFGMQPPLVPFRDAAFAICTYHLEVLDCVRALARAASLRQIDLAAFNPDAYSFYDKIEHGDLNWIIPGKLLAFSGPLARRREVDPGKWTLTAEDYVPIFRELGVTCVIRFNKRCYDRRRFVEGGIKHVDLYYEDGGNPSEQILQRFLRICENTKGAIAIHCKAGLGRTGTNIALFMIKHYGYTAAEAIALCRICRPGSIVGPQQQFLHNLEHRMRREGELYNDQYRSGTRGGRGVTRGSVNMPAGRSSALLAPSRQTKLHHRSRTDPSTPASRGGTKLAIRAGSRPTTSPLLMRRQKPAGTVVGEAQRGNGETPTEAHRGQVGNRWVGGEEGLVVSADAGPGRGSILGGARDSDGEDMSRRDLQVGNTGKIMGFKQGPRKGGTIAIGRKRSVAGGGSVGVDESAEMLRLGNVNGVTAADGATDSGGSGRSSDRDEGGAGAKTSSVRGKLLPLGPTSAARTAASQMIASSPAERADLRVISGGGGSSSSPSAVRGRASAAGATGGSRGISRSAARTGRATSAWYGNGEGVWGRRREETGTLVERGSGGDTEPKVPSYLGTTSRR